ncbi:hypothetical protein ACP70R_037058 [Stipagrostis hirtigluma subsp. patula]
MALVHELRELGEAMEDERAVKKMLLVVPAKFNQVAVSIEMLMDLSKVSMEELVSRLRVAEDRIGGEQEADGGPRLLLTEEQWEARRRNGKERARGGEARRGGDARRGSSSDKGGDHDDDDGGSSTCSGRSERRNRGRCFNCGVRGHIAKYCPEKKKEKTLLADVDEEPLELSGHRLRSTPGGCGGEVRIAGSARATGALGDLVSSCCPRLRRLDVEHAGGMRKLLWFGWAASIAGGGNFIDRVARIAAPVLQDIAMSIITPYSRLGLYIHDLSSVRRLSDLRLGMHGQYHHRDIGSLWLLENCTGVDNIKISIHHCSYHNYDGELVDMLMEGAPQFAHVRSMFVEAHSIPEDHLVASISSLLLRFPCMRSWCIKFIDTVQGPLSPLCSCDDLENWRYHCDIPLQSLEEVNISGFTGSEKEMDLVTLLFGSSNSMKNMSLCADAEELDVVSLKWIMAEEDDNDILTGAAANLPQTEESLLD